MQPVTKLKSPSISDDWLNAFENEASQMSSQQMQLLFGKILAGEIRKPTSYSIKAVKLMAQLDNRAASLFRLLCSLSVSLRLPHFNFFLDARVVSMGNAGQNSLQSYGLGFDALNTLQEYGLIIADYNSMMDYKASVAHDGLVAIPIFSQDKPYGLIPKTATPQPQALNVSGVAFLRLERSCFP